MNVEPSERTIRFGYKAGSGFGWVGVDFRVR